MNKVIDIVGNNHLFHEGTVDQGMYGSAPYVAYNGSTNYSHNKSDVLHGANGLTAGGWFLASAGDHLMGIWGEEFCWKLYLDVGVTPYFVVSDDGSSTYDVNGLDIDNTKWNHFVGRFDPSNEVAIFVNGVKYSSPSAPANIHTGLAYFSIGGEVYNSFWMTGRASNCFVCQAVVPDAQLQILYQMSKNLYGR